MTKRRSNAAAESGSASLVMLALAAVVVIFGLLIADVSVYLEARGRAQVAADAAALAAAPVTFRAFGSSGSASDEAAAFAVRNGAQLISCRCAQDGSWRTRIAEVTVAVPVELTILGATTVRAWSSAEFVPTDLAK